MAQDTERGFRTPAGGGGAAGRHWDPSITLLRGPFVMNGQVIRAEPMNSFIPNAVTGTSARPPIGRLRGEAVACRVAADHSFDS